MKKLMKSVAEIGIRLFILCDILTIMFHMKSTTTLNIA